MILVAALEKGRAAQLISSDIDQSDIW